MTDRESEEAGNQTGFRKLMWAAEGSDEHKRLLVVIDV